MTTLRTSFPIASLHAIERLARSSKDLIAPGGTILLNGPLGAGKTTLVQAWARELGVSDNVTSPTFDLLHIYDQVHPVIYHVDGYRLHEISEWDVLDLPDVSEPGILILAEWGQMLQGTYPTRLEVSMELGQGEKRTVHMEAFGEEWIGRLKTWMGEHRDGV